MQSYLLLVIQLWILKCIFIFMTVSLRWHRKSILSFLEKFNLNLNTAFFFFFFHLKRNCTLKFRLSKLSILMRQVFLLGQVPSMKEYVYAFSKMLDIFKFCHSKNIWSQYILMFFKDNFFVFFSFKWLYKIHLG